MIRYLRHGEIDKLKWDDTMSRSFNGMLYGYSWYLDIVHPEWEALISGDYEIIFPLTGKTKYGIHYLAQPWFTQQLGIFTANRQLSPELIGQFIRAIPSRFSYIEINFNTFNRIEDKSIEIHEYLTHHLDLIQPYEKISGDYSENLKRNIRKAADAAIFVARNVNPGQVIQLFRENKGKEIKKWKDLEYAMLERLIYRCLQKDKAQVWGAFTKQNQLCAGAFFAESNGKVVFLFSASDDTSKESGAIPFLIDAFIRENAGRNLVLDFEGSVQPGLARFYKSFGSKECIYLQVIINRLPWFIRWLKK